MKKILLVLALFPLVTGGSVKLKPCGCPEGSHDYIKPARLEKIRKCLPYYLYGEQVVGTPWQVLACLHYRESDVRVLPWVGGPYKMDRGGHRAEFEKRIRKHERYIARKYGYDESATIKRDFWFASICAAHDYREHARRRKLTDLKGLFFIYRVADGLWGYNGRSRYHTASGQPDGTQSWKTSPFVSNDPKRKKIYIMRFKNRSGRVVTYPDTRPGALVIFREIRRHPCLHESARMLRERSRRGGYNPLEPADEVSPVGRNK